MRETETETEKVVFSYYDNDKDTKVPKSCFVL